MMFFDIRNLYSGVCLHVIVNIVIVCPSMLSHAMALYSALAEKHLETDIFPQQ